MLLLGERRELVLVENFLIVHIGSVNIKISTARNTQVHPVHISLMVKLSSIHLSARISMARFAMQQRALCMYV